MREINPDCPLRLAELIHALLAEAPESRPNSAGEVASQLRLMRKQQMMDVAETARSASSSGVEDYLGRPDTRRYRRLSANLDARVTPKTTDAQTARIILSKIRDLSESGAFIATSKPLPTGSFVNLEFQLRDGGSRIQVLGLVRWISDDPERPGMGVQFLEVSTGDRADLRQFIGENAGPEMVRNLTRTDKHRLALREVVTNFGRVLPLGVLAHRLGASREEMAAIVEDFGRYGLVKQTRTALQCLAPTAPGVTPLLRQAAGLVATES